MSHDNHLDRMPGIWWFSDDAENVMPGDLLVEDGELELNGSFDGMKPGAYGPGKPGLRSARRNRVIQGVSRNGGKKYTLEYFDEPSSRFSMPGYKADTYKLGHIFEGAHFSRTNNLAFERYYIELPHLLEWVNDGVIGVQMIFPADAKTLSKDTTFKIEIGSPKDIKVFTGTKFKLSFLIQPHGMSMAPPMNLSEKCLLKLESVKKDLSLADAGAVVAHFERFLSIATGRNIEAIRFQAASGSAPESRTVTMLSYVSAAGDNRRLTPHEMNFVLSDMKSDSQTIFEKWFDDMHRHVDMFDLFSAIRSSSSKNINNHFKDIVSAIEGYVCIEESKAEVSPEYALKVLNEKLPKPDRPLTSADYSNIRITRNKLAHLIVKPDANAHILNDADKWLNIQRMTFLLEYSLLKGLGMSNEMLSKFHEKRKAYI